MSFEPTDRSFMDKFAMIETRRDIKLTHPNEIVTEQEERKSERQTDDLCMYALNNYRDSKELNRQKVIQSL